MAIMKWLDIDSFNANEDWLTQFNNRHDLDFRTVSGEVGNVPTENIKEWTENLSCLIKDYDSKNILNIDETELFYIAKPSVKGYILKEKNIQAANIQNYVLLHL